MNLINRVFSTLLIFTALSFVACQGNESVDKNITKVKDKLESSEIISQKDLEAEKKVVKDNLKTATSNLELKLEKLKLELAEANDEAKDAIQKQLDDLEAQRDLLKADLEKVDKEIADNWAEAKMIMNSRIEEAKKELEEELEEDM